MQLVVRIERRTSPTRTEDFRLLRAWVVQSVRIMRTPLAPSELSGFDRQRYSYIHRIIAYRLAGEKGPRRFRRGRARPGDQTPSQKVGLITREGQVPRIGGGTCEGGRGAPFAA
jgi:hypothetical protein